MDSSDNYRKNNFQNKIFLIFRKKFKALHLRYLLNTTLLFFMLAKISQPFSAFLIVFLYSTSLSFSSSEGFYIARDHIVSFCFSFLQKDLDVFHELELSVCPSIYLPIYLSMYLTIYLYLSVYI